MQRFRENAPIGDAGSPVFPTLVLTAKGPLVLSAHANALQGKALTFIERIKLALKDGSSTGVREVMTALAAHAVTVAVTG
jgi:hypothetical protein